MSRFGSGVLPELQQVTIQQAAVRTVHVLTGALILATGTAMAILAHAGEAKLVNSTSVSAVRLEGAA
jgi:hypothetical protein